MEERFFSFNLIETFFENIPMLNKNISEIFDDIINGKNVKRTYHELIFNGIDYTEAFIESLNQHGFSEMTVDQTDIHPGFRLPGFLIRNQAAIFGYVFWELFNTTQKRKLWGSVILNKKGDWKYTVSEKNQKKLWLNNSQKEEINLATYGLSLKK